MVYSSFVSAIQVWNKLSQLFSSQHKEQITHQDMQEERTCTSKERKAMDC